MRIIVGIDIGGTKSAISFACYEAGKISFLDKIKEPTITDDYRKAFSSYIKIIKEKLTEHPEWRLSSIGISCGGPLNARLGIIQAPPNLPHWEDADIFTPLTEAFQVPVMLQNDADACALAEWTMGAGKGTSNMIFLTFGTGMGAGLVLNGELYSGTNGLAGEVGHIRLKQDGPFGYGKKGSFEGYCSGGGIADLGRIKAHEALKAGKSPIFCRSKEEISEITCQSIAEALEQGDETARQIFDVVAEHLGLGLSILIDILNPEMIVIGSIYARQQQALERGMLEVIEREALRVSGNTCTVVPAKLGELIGDYAAVSVGVKALKDLRQERDFS